MIGNTPSAAGQEISAPAPQPATVIGTVLDVNGGLVPGATVILSSSNPSERLTTVSDENGFFQFTKVPAAVDCHVSIRMRGFADWTSKTLELNPGQYFLLTGIQLHLATVQVSVTALTPQQMAAEEVRTEEKQHILGFIPNFFAVYDTNPTPLPAKLKFHVALGDHTDPVTLGAFVLNASIYQAGGYPDYRGGVAGYGQVLGSTFAGGYTNILIT